MPTRKASPAKLLAQRITDAANRAATEEDLRVAVEKAISGALTSLGISATPEYEKTILSGSADAVYGHVVIEYKKPGRLATASSRETIVRQLARYMIGDSSRHGLAPADALSRMIGIALDGRSLVFVRHIARDPGNEFSLPGLPQGFASTISDVEAPGFFQALGPYPVGEDSVNVLLMYLRSLARKPLTPEALSRDFGPSGQIASRLVQAFHASLVANIHRPGVSTFFGEWQRIFGIVYGEDHAKARADAQELARLYGVQGKVDLQPLLFSVHTYFALLMKFLALELMSLQGGILVSSFASQLPAMTDGDLNKSLSDIEDGGLFRQMGIVNFVEGDFFRWYLTVWNPALSEAIRAFGATLADFEPSTSTLEPEATRDLLKKLYQYLIPKALRHDLGEYYTPDWLAERLLTQAGYDGDPAKRLIDPACGSGTFPILAIKRLRAHAAGRPITSQEVAHAALKNIVGFDLNPLAVIAARTNFLLALGDLIRYVRPIEIPIYMCDAILAPEEASGQLDLFSTVFTVHTASGDFAIPAEVVKARQVEELCMLIEEAVAAGYPTKDFLARARASIATSQPTTEATLKQLYERIAALHAKGRDGIWARLIKNAFAPLFCGQFDYVVGNPPWINWESLSAEYREATTPVWQRYEMSAKSGSKQFELGKVKRDISMLFVYVCMDRYLKQGGTLAFVITQTIFKTASGEVFRNFRLNPSTPIRMRHVDDMVQLQPFEDASNWTSVMVCDKGEPTRYPVTYTLWRKSQPGAISTDLALEDVVKRTRRLNYVAEPINPSDKTSHWITGRPKAIAAARAALGESDYDARAGLVTWADGIYWLELVEVRPDGLLQITNLHDQGKRSIEKVTLPVEPALVYPFARWTDIERWSCTPSCLILLPHTKEGGWRPIPETEMRVRYPKAYSYLATFKDTLLLRSGYKQLRQGEPFYILSNTGPWIFSDFKVAWKAMAPRMEAVVLSPFQHPALGQRTIMHKNTVVFIASDSPEEAHYLCAVLNSTPVDYIARSYSVGKSFGSPHLLKQIAIPRFDLANELHARLSEISREAHAAPATSLSEIESRLDDLIAPLWGIKSSAIEQMRANLLEQQAISSQASRPEE
jgi:hypothetical protein